MYLMTHKDHGQHICYTPEDVEAHKAIGWVPVEEARPVDPELSKFVAEYFIKPLTERKKPGPKPKAK